jgi:hypothetical protein
MTSDVERSVVGNERADMLVPLGQHMRVVIHPKDIWRVTHIDEQPHHRIFVAVCSRFDQGVDSSAVCTARSEYSGKSP